MSIRLAVLKALAAGLLAAVIAIAPARAADPIFPLNSRVGMIPPPGFVPSTKFPGFENPTANATIVIVDLPPEAYADIEKTFTDEALKSRGVTVESRDTIEFKDGRGIIITGEQVVGAAKRRDIVMAATLSGFATLVSVQIAEESRAAVPDEVVREAFKTIVARAAVPDEEKLSALPYKLGNLAGFRVVRGSPDGNVLLTEGPDDTVAAVAQPFVLIGLAPSEIPKPEERDAFARKIFLGVPGLKDIKILRAEPQRINGQSGYEILAEAKEQRSNTEVTTVQWLRFGQNGYLQIFAIARREAWNDLFPRLRALRDSIELR